MQAARTLHKGFAALTGAFMLAAAGMAALPAPVFAQAADAQQQEEKWTPDQVQDFIAAIDGQDYSQVYLVFGQLRDAVVGDPVLTETAIRALPALLENSNDQNIWQQAARFLESLHEWNDGEYDTLAADALEGFLRSYTDKVKTLTDFAQIELNLYRGALIAHNNPVLVNARIEAMAAAQAESSSPYVWHHVFQAYTYINRNHPGQFEKKINALLQPSFDELKKILDTGTDDNLRTLAVWLLCTMGEIGSGYESGIAEALLPVMQDTNPQRQAFAAKNLARFAKNDAGLSAKAYEAYQPLVSQLENLPDDMPYFVIQGVAVSGASAGRAVETVDVLEHIARSSPEHISAEAINMLAYIPGNAPDLSGRVYDVLRGLVADDIQPTYALAALAFIAERAPDLAMDIIKVAADALGGPYQEDALYLMERIANSYEEHVETILLFVKDTVDSGRLELENYQVLSFLNRIGYAYDGAYLGEVMAVMQSAIENAVETKKWGTVSEIANDLEDLQRRWQSMNPAPSPGQGTPAPSSP